MQKTESGDGQKSVLGHEMWDIGILAGQAREP